MALTGSIAQTVYHKNCQVAGPARKRSKGSPPGPAPQKNPPGLGAQRGQENFEKSTAGGEACGDAVRPLQLILCKQILFVININREEARSVCGGLTASDRPLSFWLATDPVGMHTRMLLANGMTCLRGGLSRTRLRDVCGMRCQGAPLPLGWGERGSPPPALLETAFGPHPTTKDEEKRIPFHPA